MKNTPGRKSQKKPEKTRVKREKKSKNKENEPENGLIQYQPVALVADEKLSLKTLKASTESSLKVSKWNDVVQSEIMLFC